MPAPLNAYTKTSPQGANPQQTGSSDAHPLPTIQEASNGNFVDEHLTTSKHKRPNRPRLSAPAITPVDLRPTTNVGAWKAPEDWAVSPTESAISGVGTEDIHDMAVTEQLASLTLDLARMEREAGHMQSASPRLILQHLKDSCDDCEADAVRETDQDEGDRVKASRTGEVTLACHDREMSKQRWLMSALHNMETVCDMKEDLPKPAQQHVGRKILALFENQGQSRLSTA